MVQGHVAGRRRQRPLRREITNAHKGIEAPISPLVSRAPSHADDRQNIIRQPHVLSRSGALLKALRFEQRPEVLLQESRYTSCGH